jgi:hypothetical protein
MRWALIPRKRVTNSEIYVINFEKLRVFRFPTSQRSRESLTVELNFDKPALTVHYPSNRKP